MKNFDVVVWGASGFTGRLVAQYLAETYGIDGELRWAVAGRSESKLQDVAASCGFGGVAILIADSHDEAAIRRIAEQTTVICSTVGPYALYGSPLVKICSELGVHYCDLTGEVQWMRDMIETHHATAEASGAKIVHTCGFDSVPSDLGVHFLQKAFQSEYECFADTVHYRMMRASGGASGGTIASMLNMLAEADKNPSLVDLLADDYSLNPPNSQRGPDMPGDDVFFFDETLRRWVSPFVMAAINTRVVRRSHALLGNPYGATFRYQEGTDCGPGFKGYARGLAASLLGKFGMGLLGLRWARRMITPLLPKPGEGPDEKARNAGFFEVQLHGRRAADPSQRLTVQVTGDRDPGYGSTAKMIAEAAVCLAKDPLPEGGGILTPSVSLGDAYVDRLTQKAGLTFTVLG